eukprot:CAMPEP_0119302106 /NCGR_PEP_ID=MMETSP1333-20130426/3769_1 /TAXON_ID=418940 /ORGANISM="Scyphosphaera apsteinii, Strain RCC1455" /LENGTH=61 /DNA_ID=CAMNT_0007304363 /DNA_START=1332 /DNA_END=1517 /DNA_ORIENTATION=-
MIGTGGTSALLKEAELRMTSAAAVIPAAATTESHPQSPTSTARAIPSSPSALDGGFKLRPE